MSEEQAFPEKDDAEEVAQETAQPVAAEDMPAAEQEAAGDADGVESGEDELAALKEQLARVSKALAEANIRAQAEVQNMRRRAERDVEKAHKFALEKFAKDILSVADSLERGLAAIDKDNEALKPAREGLELTQKQLLDVFSRFQIVQLDPVGAPFDPETQEAMTQIPYPDAEPNSVVDVLEKGYSLNGRLLRPARVVVSK